MLHEVSPENRRKSAGVLVLKGAKVVDGLSDSLKDGVTITVEDGIITGIGKEDELTIPPGANVLNLSGKTVMPGLIDSHLHLSQSGVDDFVKPYAEKMEAKLKRNAYLTLKSGVTTVRNMPGGTGKAIYKFREKVKQEKVLGPRILASGPALAPSYGYFSLKRFFPPNPFVMSLLSRIFGAHGLAIDVDSQEKARETVKELKKEGADFIKTVTPGAHMPFVEKDEKLKEELQKKGMKLETIEASMQPEVLEAIVEEAHNEGLKVAAHTICWPKGFKEAVTAGVDSVEHTPLGVIDDETFDLMKSKNIYWTPTAYCYYNWSDFIDNPEQYDNEEIRELIPEPFHAIGKKSLEQVREGIKSGEDLIWGNFYAEMKPFKESYFPKNFKNAVEKGVKIVAGVDAGASGAGYVPHGQLSKELELFVEHGMSEFEAIKTATINAAELLGLEKELGSIEIGKTADFVVLESSPLEDISNLNNINCVIKGGILAYQKD
ncbi:amidohydrolase family protein [Dethiobacter alkaliphilus]|uniref:amidohydrolase family protein n=1 Tax=Dethiobacter alkaliphilus TaxID=427926 RepID=UPI002227D28D|nr:amidohydrolase family protein [Dethiobacter alkaliphilus]MCW3491703.1 amidohydrolase family protein [Dethiobacter alkaliphilus]